MSSNSATTKGTLVLKNLGTDFSLKNTSTSGSATFKVKRDDVTASLVVSDQTLRSPQSLKDVTATVDYKVAQVKGLTVNTKYEFSTAKYQAGVTYNTSVANKPLVVKGTYNSKDGKISGDATVTVSKDQKANVVFNQEKVNSAKYTVARDGFTFEPSYNFDKKAAAFSVSKKQGSDNLKLSYDLQSENAAFEWSRYDLF